MTYRSQRIAYLFFATSMLLLTLQLLYGFIMAFAHMGYDVLHAWIPFNTARATHTNLLVVWLLSGFMGAAYYIIPEEAEREIYSEKLAVAQWAALVIVGVIAIVGFHFNWWEGRKFLEIPRPLDYLVVVDVLLFLFNVGMTALKGKRLTTTGLVLFSGLLSAALLYLPGVITFQNQVRDSYFRWWVVHLWVEGVWELIMGSILSYLLIKLTGVDREVIEKWLYIIVGLTFLSGILGTGHHYYFIGTPKYWLMIGGIFSALEPIAFLGMAIYAVTMMRRGGRRHPNRVALFWTVGCGIMSFVGAGFLGFAHTVPQVNRWTHGTLVTAMHGHLAFWGAYAMIVLAVIMYAMPQMTGRKLYQGWMPEWAFWISNIGMIGMTGAFAVAGIAQVYLERKVGMEFLEVQKSIEVHFGGLALAGTLFTVGIILYLINFIGYGLPSSAALPPEESQEEPGAAPEPAELPVHRPPYYRPVRDEIALFEHAFREHLPVMLKGPTGCGKSRFVEAMAARLGRPLVTVACHDETSAVDLVGRYLVKGGETVWQDGPVTRAVRAGAILYLDEIAEARPDVVVVIHPLSDHRRRIYIEAHDEEVEAAAGFHLVVSFNPGYQRGMKELKPSTRQRFVALAFDYPPAEVEAEILQGEAGIDAKIAKKLAALAHKLRRLDALGLAEAPSTRLFVDAARMIKAGTEPRRACDAAVVQPLTDDLTIAEALSEAVALAF